MRRKNGKFSVLAIIGMASALFATACKGSEASYDPAINYEPTVYGPPVTTSQDYDPAENIPDEVYGPPESFEEPNEQTEQPSGGISFQEVSPNDTFSPDISGNLKNDVSGDDGEFKPSDNIAEPVYGPPAGETEGANE